jgi:YfiH family protein
VTPWGARVFRNDLGLWAFEARHGLGGVPHAFAPADAWGGYDAHRREDRVRLRDALAPTNRLVETHQTHSAHVAIVTDRTTSAELAAADLGGIDALVTRIPGVLLHAIAADCPLVFFADRDADAVALAHSGWRGTVGGVVASTVSTLVDGLGARRERLHAGIAPAAAGCCYEIGPEVVARFAALPVDVSTALRASERGDHAYLDLERVLIALLEREGITRDRIETAATCTICGGARFHSHRRAHGRAGRMSGVIACAGERVPRAE